MNIQEIYELGVKLGINADLRGSAKVKKNLKRVNDKYDKLSSEDKKHFDKERLWNPYSDTRVYVDHKKEVKKVLVGIDIKASEILIAKELGCDLIIGHHPIGSALSDLHDVMYLQAEVLADYGVPINIAESMVKERMDEVARGTSPINTYRSVDTAKLFNIGLMCCHTPTDNLVANFLKEKMNKAKPEYVGDVLEVLRDIEEYQIARTQKMGPTLFAGNKDNYAGKVVLTEITGGTEGAVGIYEKMSNAGIGTIVGMHMAEDRKKEAQKYHMNIVIAGHMSSDSLGVNLFLDELEKKGIEIVPCSGLIRVSRVKKSKPKSKVKKKVVKKKRK
ncbi:MAG: NGG1p interacting factor NIF3 [Parcubacteria group bacterium]|jgi:hypothetical protein|nr:NGG1p interacting factor NIF3 [Parcubacteria group bacterium]|tara:strand:- start:1976 stop:2971 length:996 start_codon:yes stop_codon:yes gene_type:complete